MKNLYKANFDELIKALIDSGITSDNVSSSTNLYEAKDGSIKASNCEPVDLRYNGRCEKIGFFLWCSSEEYDKAQSEIENIFEKIEAGFQVNINALKRMLDEYTQYKVS